MTDSNFFFHLQSQQSLWDGNCCSHVRALSCIGKTWLHHLKDIHGHAWTHSTKHKHRHQQCISSTNENETPALCCNCGCVFSFFVSKDYVCEAQGPIDCFECLFTVYDCAAPQVFNKAAPLECSIHISIVALCFYRYVFLHSLEYNQWYLSGLGFWLIQWI